MVVIRTGRIEFTPATGAQTRTQMVWFPTMEIRACWVGLGGYSMAYVSGDHEVKTIEVGVRCALRDTEFGRGVEVSATLFLSDKNADDRFRGWVDFIAFVDVGPPPIVGKVLELTLALR